MAQWLPFVAPHLTVPVPEVVDALGVSGDEWTRAKGWALFVAIVTFPYYWETMPTRCTHRRVMAQAVLDERRAR